jgi:pimeloyl-ACP methyl ester carboxylesterase
VKSQELSCTVSGIGSIPLICLHGWACDGSQFGELSKLLDKDFRIFCPDLPGHGKTPLNGFNPGFRPYARLIADFSKSQKLERPVLLGHSMGGVLCLMAAAEGGIQPRAVINLDGSLPAASKSSSGFQSLRAFINTPDFRDRLALMVRESFFLDSERDARCEAIVQAMCSAPDPVLRFVPEQAGSLCAEQILPNVRVPVLYVGGANPRFDADRAASLIPRVAFEQFPEAGHFLHIYAVKKLAATLRQFQGKSHSAG